MIAALVGALLVLAGAYWFAIRANGAEGRHRLTPDHPGWETALEDLYALRRRSGSL